MRSTPALEALARCVTESETAMIYRCFFRYVRDQELSELFARMSKDEIKHYNYFRKLFFDYNNVEKHKLENLLQTMVKRTSQVKTQDLQIAFNVINTAWHSQAPFKVVDFHTYVQELKKVMKSFFLFDKAARLLVNLTLLKGWRRKLLLVYTKFRIYRAF